LSTRPVLRRRGWSVAAAVLGSLLALVTTGSPARYAVTALVTGSRTGTFDPPVLALLGAVALAGTAAFVVCQLAARRG
ncbi:ABC transporter, partial [Streptomyces parvus]|nr:ABC transporter [Streptomyces parvus]